jgi:hypothetical protein
MKIQGQLRLNWEGLFRQQLQMIEEFRHQKYWVQFSGVESLPVKGRLYLCYSTAIFGVCNSMGLFTVPVCTIRCHETDSGGCNILRTLVFALVNCKVRWSAVPLYYLQLWVECISAIIPNNQSKPRLTVTPTRDNIILRQMLLYTDILLKLSLIRPISLCCVYFNIFPYFNKCVLKVNIILVDLSVTWWR